MTDLHNVDPVRDVVELPHRPAGPVVEDECVQVVPQAERDIERHKSEHEDHDDDHGPVDSPLEALPVKKERPRTPGQGHDVDAVGDGLHKQSHELGFSDGELI